MAVAIGIPKLSYFLIDHGKQAIVFLNAVVNFEQLARVGSLKLFCELVFLDFNQLKRVLKMDDVFLHFLLDFNFELNAHYLFDPCVLLKLVVQNFWDDLSLH